MEDVKGHGTEIRFRDLFAVFKRCWWLMLALAILVGGSAYAFLYVTHEDEYTATATIWAMGNNAQTATTDNTATTQQDVYIASYLINDYKELIVSPKVLKETVKRAGSDMKWELLKSRINISNTEETRVLYVSVMSEDKEESKALADNRVEVFCEMINETNEEGRPLIRVFDKAEEPNNISNPIPVLLLAVVSFATAILVYVLFLIFYVLDDRINTAEDVEYTLGLNLLGVIPNREDARRRGLRKKRYYYYQTGKDPE